MKWNREYLYEIIFTVIVVALIVAAFVIACFYPVSFNKSIGLSVAMFSVFQ